jgi:hypothetical protein
MRNESVARAVRVMTGTKGPTFEDVQGVHNEQAQHLKLLDVSEG